MIAIESIATPTLVAGDYDMTFGQFEKVTEAAVSLSGPNENGVVYEASRTLATNVVTIHFEKLTIGVNTWGNASTGDIDLVTVVAEGV